MFSCIIRILITFIINKVSNLYTTILFTGRNTRKSQQKIL